MDDVRAQIAAAAVLGLIVGGVVAFVAGGVLVDREAKGMPTTVDGWSTVRQCGEPGDDILLKAACARDWTAANLPPEAGYWTTAGDRPGAAPFGHNGHRLPLPAGGPPPHHPLLLPPRD